MKLDQAGQTVAVETKQGRFIFCELEDGSLSVYAAGHNSRIKVSTGLTDILYYQLTLSAVNERGDQMTGGDR